VPGRAAVVRPCARRAGAARVTAAPTGQGGASLLEVLLAVVLVGTVIIALAAGMLALIRATRTTSDQQRAQSALLSYAESLKSSPYLPCGSNPPPSPAAYEASHDAQPERWNPADHARLDASIDRVQFWHDGGGYGTYEDNCPAGGDRGRQLLTVTVQLADGPTASGPVVLTERPDPPADDEEEGS